MMENSTPSSPTVRVLGTHGVPAAYGGFETAAEHIGLHLADRGWRVIVYCQAEGKSAITTDVWRGLERVTIHEQKPGWLGTASFDFKSIAHALRNAGPADVCLTFGYNTGIFNIAQRLRRIPNVINMDGMEWTRARWGLLRQGILLINERFSGLVGDVLVADHPEIARYLRRHFGSRRVVTITYGAVPVHDAPTDCISSMGLVPRRYATVICRPIPENSLLEIVTAWSAARRGMPLVVLGAFTREDAYHARVLDAASEEVQFLGAIYDPDIVSSLRFHGAVYLHGHTVGGTNPSLVEAMAAHNAVIAHDNVFNRWVAGPDAHYFSDTQSLQTVLDEVLNDALLRAHSSESTYVRFEKEFTWQRIGRQYEHALLCALRRRRPEGEYPRLDRFITERLSS